MGSDGCRARGGARDFEFRPRFAYRSECFRLFYRVHRIRVGTYNAALHIIVNIQVHTSDRKNIVK